MGMIAVMVVQALLLALGVLLMLAFVVGVAVFVRPALLERFERALDRQYSMEHITRTLDTPRDIDRYFYRHHRLYGAVVVLLSVGLLSFLAFGHPSAAWYGLFDASDRAVGPLLADTARLVLWILGLFALVIGTVVFVRPSALKALEQRVNRWLAPQGAMRTMEREFHGPERWLRRHARAWALLIAVASGLCLAALILQVTDILAMVG